MSVTRRYARGLLPRRQGAIEPRTALLAAGGILLFLIIVIALLSRSGPSASSGRTPPRTESAATTPPPAPPVRRTGPAEPPAVRLATVTGMRVDGRRQLRFVGATAGPDTHVLSPWRLAEYFAVALRAYAKHGRAPALSIDPTPRQVSQGINMTGDQNVRYECGCENTSLGLVTFAADRRMKCLSHGQDNITLFPVASSLAGYRSLPDMVLAHPDQSPPQAQHRLWIQSKESRIWLVDGGRGLDVEIEIEIAVKRQEVRNGELVDVGVEPDPATKAFAQHLTDHFDDYAAEDPTFAELRAALKMSALAKAIWENTHSSQFAADCALDVSWWTEQFPVRDLATPEHTPVGRVTRTNRTATYVHTVTVVGGVDCEPEGFRCLASGKPPRRLAEEQCEVPAGEKTIARMAEASQRQEYVTLTCRQEGNDGDWNVKWPGGETTPLGPKGLEMPGGRTTVAEQADLATEHLPHANHDIVMDLPKGYRGAETGKLRESRPNLDFLVSHDPKMAEVHLQELINAQARPRNLSLVVNEDSLDEEQLEQLSGYDRDMVSFPQETRGASLSDVPAEADTVVVVAEVGQLSEPGDFASDYLKALEERRLASKTVNLIVCGTDETEQFLERSFKDAEEAPYMVVGFNGPIDPDLVPRLLEEMSTVVSEEPNIRPDDIMKNALERLSSSEGGLDEEQQSRFKGLSGMLYKMLSRLQDSGAPLIVAA